MLEFKSNARNPSLFKRIISFVILSILLSLFCIVNYPVTGKAATGQTTIIALDPNRDYQKGEKVKVTVGVSTTDGSFLKSANCGFGYNGATMKLLTETDTKDHFLIESETPTKWLYKDLEFEMIADGTMYFIAGAYSGDGVIKGTRADGSWIDLPRASVVRKVGTGIYTKVSDCNLATLEIKDEDGNEIKMNRPFNKNETEYWIENEDVGNSVSISASAENSQDEIIVPDLVLQPGDNVKNIYVEAADGTRKKYTIHITKPQQPVSFAKIQLFDSKGKEIDYDFSSEISDYILEVDNEISEVNFKGSGESKETKFEYPKEKTLSVGYNNFTVKVYTDTEEKIYSYNIFRKSLPLRILSIVGELSDGTILKLDKEFDPEINEYTATCTSDIKKINFVCTVSQDGAFLKKNPEFKLQEGVNICELVLTNDVGEENKYIITIFKDAYDKTEKPKEEYKPIHNDNIIRQFHFKDHIGIAIIGGLILFSLIVFIIKQLLKYINEYNTSDEKKNIDEEKARKQREKAIKKSYKEKQRQKK